MLPTTLEITSSSRVETEAIGEQIGRLAGPGDIILLSGPLGAGKTCLTQGIAQGLDIPDNIPSPTFMLMREYRGGRLPLYHIDLYRLEFNEVADLGLDEYLFGQGVSAVEWAEKDPLLMTGDHLFIEIAYAGECGRSLRLQPRGARYSELLEAFEVKLNTGKNS